jgi:alanine racemase
MVNDVWVEVDLNALRHNLLQVRSLLSPNIKIMAVVKGFGFGHGIAQPARAFVGAGAEYLGVTRLEEALPIREANIQIRTLVFAPIQPANADYALSLNLDLTVESLTLAQAISAAAVRRGDVARVHIKVDTGMTRLGVLPDEFPSIFGAIRRLPGISVAGVYTHFGSATDPDANITQHQIERFTPIHHRLRMEELDPPIVHAANSAAFLRFPEARYNMVRIGTLLYGQYPAGDAPQKLLLQPTWKLKARIASVKTVPAGSRVGYGGEYITTRVSRLAIVPLGYADGFTMAPEGPIYRQSPARFIAKKMSRALNVELHRQQVPVVGRVSMQMTTIDVTDCLEVAVGDEVTLPALRLAANPLIPRVYI